MVGDVALARWRTFVQVNISAWLLALASWILDKTGAVDLTSYVPAVAALVFGLGTAGYYVVATWINKRWPVVGKFLLGSKTRPTYVETIQPH